MRALAIAVVCVTLGACDKGEPAKVAPAADLALFKQLPKGANVVLGGNYMKMQAWLNSGLGDAMKAVGPGWNEYARCWADLPGAKLVGTANITAGGADSTC